MKIAIIKADDIRAVTTKWDRFFALSKEKGVKVSAGVICDSLSKDKKDYADWLHGLSTSGGVELWNHGWDHKRWENAAKETISEFGGSGYAHQKQHFDDAQNAMREVLGAAPIALGTPFNAVDADTLRVINEDKTIRLVFTYKPLVIGDKTPAPMTIRGEHDGTGKPNFEKFKTEYAAKPNMNFSAIQFHPNAFEDAHFAEYAKILDFLKAEGWVFMLPAEYVAKTALPNTQK